MPTKTKRHSKPRALKEKTTVQYSTKYEKAKGRQVAQEAELDREIQKHVGKWVAILGGRVVAVGDTVEAVMRAAQKLGHDTPTVVRGPLTAEETLYVFAA